MRFGSTSVRKWAREWRESDWRETIPLSSGRECPDCYATVCGGRSWRAHAQKEAEDTERFNELVQAVHVLAAALERAGLVTVHRRGGEDQEVPEVTGYVIGSGPLPAETRGGED